MTEWISKILSTISVVHPNIATLFIIIKKEKLNHFQTLIIQKHGAFTLAHYFSEQEKKSRMVCTPFIHL